MARAKTATARAREGGPRELREGGERGVGEGAEPQVRDYMTPSPHWIGAQQALSEAKGLMQEFKIRHLPVLSESRLVGVVSDRDLGVIESVLHTETLPVADAMTPDPYAVAPGTPLRQVAREMANRRCGSAVVMEGDEVLGIFTTTDALDALAEALEERAAPAGRPPVSRRRGGATRPGPARRARSTPPRAGRRPAPSGRARRRRLRARAA